MKEVKSVGDKVVLFAIVLLVFSCFFTISSQIIKKFYSVPPVPTPTSPSIIVGAEYEFYPAIKAEFQKIKESYNSEIVESNDLQVWWISPDGLNIINDNSSGIELNSFNCEGDLSPQPTFTKMAQLTGSKVDEIMLRNGFKVNQKNSSKSIEDDQFYDYIRAYEKGSVLAVFTANPECHARLAQSPMFYTFSLGFTNSLDDNYKQQAPYLKDLGINKAIIHVYEKVGDFVKLGVNYRRSGHYVIAKLISGKWGELYSGQNYPSCEIVDRYEIPKEIISDCIPVEPQN